MQTRLLSTMATQESDGEGLAQDVDQKHTRLIRVQKGRAVKPLLKVSRTEWLSNKL